MFDINKTIKEIGVDIGVDDKLVEIFISGNLGNKWISKRGLNCSVVELGMALKTIRKRLSFDFHYIFSDKIGFRRKTLLFEKMFEKYSEFKKFHQAFYDRGEKLKAIQQLLLKDETIIVDSGIGEDVFFEIIPEILNKISPDELDFFYLANTIFRWKLAEFIQSEINEKLFVRGSLIFFNARSFGCGDYANFSFEKINEKSTYYPAQGSDLDLKMKKVSYEIKKKIDKCAERINKEMKKIDSFLTLEVSEIKNIREDLLQTDELRLFLEIFKSSFDYGKLKCNIHNSANRICQKKKGKNRRGVELTDKNIDKLVLAFNKTLEYYKINQDALLCLVLAWKRNLRKAKRETDFSGIVKLDYLFLVFENLFFLSGYRLSSKERRILFNKIINKSS